MTNISPFSPSHSCWKPPSYSVLWILHMSKIVKYFSFFFLLISLSITSSSFTRVVTVYLFICLSMEGHLGCSHVLAIVNNAAISMGVQMSIFAILISDPLAIYTEMGLMNHTVVLFLVFCSLSFFFLFFFFFIMAILTGEDNISLWFWLAFLWRLHLY